MWMGKGRDDKSSVVPPAEDVDLLPAFKYVLQLTFTMLSFVLKKSMGKPSQYVGSTLNPYLTVILTFLATVSKHKSWSGLDGRFLREDREERKAEMEVLSPMEEYGEGTDGRIEDDDDDKGLEKKSGMKCELVRWSVISDTVEGLGGLKG